MDLALEECYYRFLHSLPLEEHEPERLMVNLEQAHWFYEDELLHELQVPSLKFAPFVKKMKETFELFPEYSTKDLLEIYEEYKAHIPVRGAILLNDKMDHCLMVSSYNGKILGFPKGKINQGENSVDCAIREVNEEVGFDISNMIDSECFIESEEGRLRLYIVPNVPMDFEFYTHTKGEIGAILWVKLDDIPSKKNNRAEPYSQYRFNKVHNFLGELRKWIKKNKKQEVPCVQPKLPRNLKFVSFPEFTFKKNRIYALLDHFLPIA